MQPSTSPPARGVEIRGSLSKGFDQILTTEALEFVATLARTHTDRIARLLEARSDRQRQLDAGTHLDFIPETRHVRESDWTVAATPADLVDRRVEITGPVERKMIINALNSGAQVFMADFEDSSAPTWENMIAGQVNLRDAVQRTIELVDTARDKHYRLKEKTAVLMVRPRGLHLTEQHLVVDGVPVPGCLVDFGLYFFHNAQALVDQGTGPYFYLPKLQSHLEARLWNDVFVQAQEMLGIAPGTIRATVLIETLFAAFEMHEILYELRHHAAGLNCGRWDYIFSFIKCHRAHADFILPDRGQVHMEQPFLRAYTQLLVKTCHRRKAHAMGGMAAQIPVKNDDEANRAAMEKVCADKLREVRDGHDGTWVAHPALVPVAQAIFETHASGPNQMHVMREDVDVSASDLLAVPRGRRTEAGLRQNVSVGVQYLESWLRGHGCVPLYHLMEDSATAEISRAQIWQWIRHGAQLDDGRTVDTCLFREILHEELEDILSKLNPGELRQRRFDEAAALFNEIVSSRDLPEFLTLPAYQRLVDTSKTNIQANQE